MQFKREFINAVKLLLLLSLLFWSFTWNSYELAYSHPDGTLGASSDANDANSDVATSKSELTVPPDFFSESRYESGKPDVPESTFAIFIPPFNEWKEKEMTKYVKSPLNGVDALHHKTSVRRKLNYASAKCGAKVLASNPEARHRAAVLSEKPDEYMLNPCRAKTWFVVEMCDIVEAIQFELANYELYSSSPRGFSVFWSEVYPTMEWRLLGSFEAEDRRTTQTFDLNSKNLGKFIKVIIYNNHGREHYCPLSVIRVLGYSMVQKFDALEASEVNPINAPSDSSESKPDENVMLDKKQLLSGNITEYGNIYRTSPNAFPLEICELFKYCADMSNNNTTGLCVNRPLCRFLAGVIPKFGTGCHNNFYCKASTNSVIHSGENWDGHADLSSKSLPEMIESMEGNVELSERESTYGVQQIRGGEDHSKVAKQMDSCVSDKSNAKTDISHASTLNLMTAENNSSANSSNVITEVASSKSVDTETKCMCEKSEREQEAALQAFILQHYSGAPPGDAGTVESAGLIHTESVLFKLTTRIKSSETDLNFINRYLQQLSQSYRHQMSHTRAMFEETLRTISVQSERARITDENEEQRIIALEEKTKMLILKIDFLMDGQKDFLMRVVELHGFFLILECIIISTLFTLFLNIFFRKNSPIVRYRTKIINDRKRIIIERNNNNNKQNV